MSGQALERLASLNVGVQARGRLALFGRMHKAYATIEEAMRNVQRLSSDGPLATDGMRRMTVGRVIGVVAPGCSPRVDLVA